MLYFLLFHHLFGILLLQVLANSSQLDVAGSFVDGTDLAVPEVFLRKPLSDEAHATRAPPA